jgi:hypothetical protein
MTKDENKFIVKNPAKLNTAPKMRKRAYERKAEGSRISNQHQRTFDQFESDEEKE